MKTLLYTNAFGDELYFQLAQEMVFSARRQGYEGHLLVLTDREYAFTGASCCSLPHEAGDMWKADIRRVPDFNEYEKILFVDSDIIFLKNPDLLFAMNGFLCAVEKIPLANAPLGGRYLTIPEREAHSRSGAYCLNSGTILMPGTGAGAFLTGWESAWHVQPKDDRIELWGKTIAVSGEMLDQSALQVYCERHFKRMGRFPENAIFMPGIAELFTTEKNEFVEAECIALHFNGPLPSRETKENILFCMRLCADPEKVPEVISAFRERVRATKPKTEVQVLAEGMQYCEKAFQNIFKRLEASERFIKEIKEKELSHAPG